MELSAVFHDNYHVFEFFNPQFKLPEGTAHCGPALKPNKSKGLRRGSRRVRIQAPLFRA